MLGARPWVDVKAELALRAPFPTEIEEDDRRQGRIDGRGTYASQ